MARQRTDSDQEIATLLREELESLPAVHRALVEPQPWRVHLVREALESPPEEVDVGGVLAQWGLPRDEVEVTTSYLAGPESRRRVRLRSARLEHPRIGASTARVRIEWRDRAEDGRTEGVSSETGDLRLCAFATLQAVERLVPNAPGFVLVGIKQVRVFDHDLFVVLLRASDRPEPALIGACLVREDTAHSVAAAVLNALNRSLGNYLDVAD